MKNLLPILILSFFIVSCSAQNKTSEPVSTNKYDQKLADSLGADQRGMKNYMLVILQTGPKDTVITDK
ncbi:MAG: hypothetical protein ACXWVV_05185, partial [Kaistella sp.]